MQANRYTYANASPLTGTDPTGHYTIDNGSLGGTGYGDSGSSGYTTIPAGSYNSSGSSGGGQCIGSCGREEGGGAIACMTWGCGSLIVDPEWARMIELEKEKKFWLGDDEIKRLGMKVMPNGRPVDQPNFWFASEKVQNEYMANWSPTMTDKQLAFSWVAAGGLESFATMEKAAEKNPNDARLGEWRKMQQVRGKLGSGSYALLKDAKDGSPDSLYKYYSQYKILVKYQKAIAAAAQEHHLDKRAFAAMLIYETITFEPKGGWAGDRIGSARGWTDWTSLGIGQMQIATARQMLQKYYPDKYKQMGGEKVTNEGIGRMLNHDTNMAIRLSAAYMRHLIETTPMRYYKGGGEYGTRRMTDMEAAAAYAVNPTDFVNWRAGGKAPSAEAQKRWNLIMGGRVGKAATEFWECVADAGGRPFEPCSPE
ncbi:hypothetical protein AB0392_24730 [Nonomuraea angiospora]|uniref:hypothetical protein n=1 Tax=Nonomuraea angiospora TaxID=46172 RepID=UPI00344F5B59